MKLDGAWLENNHKADTLVFNTQDLIFNLNRGKELRNGFLLPKDLSGPYFYEIKDDSINLTGALDGPNYKNFYFNLDSKKRLIMIGNFFVDSLSDHDILTFSKIDFYRTNVDMSVQ